MGLLYRQNEGYAGFLYFGRLKFLRYSWAKSKVFFEYNNIRNADAHFKTKCNTLVRELLKEE